MMSLFRFFLLEFDVRVETWEGKCEKVLVSPVLEGFLIDWCWFVEGFFTVQSKSVVMFIFNVVLEIGTNQLTCLRTVKATHCYINKARWCSLSPWFTRFVYEGLGIICWHVG